MGLARGFIQRAECGDRLAVVVGVHARIDARRGVARATAFALRVVARPRQMPGLTNMAHVGVLVRVEDAFGRNGWHAELVEGRDVLRSVFSAHHTRIEMIVQAYVPMNALAVMGEMPLPLDEEHQPYLLELLARANKTLNLGGFEYDLDRQRLVFRITNLFDRELYDADIISSMVHCAVAELDRIAPYASTVIRTPEDLLDDLDLKRLLQREDFIPPVPGDDDDLP